jgi:hypothetical protein
MGEAFNQQRDSIRERLLATKKAQLYSGYIKNRVDQLKESGEIAVRQEVIERAFIFGSDFDEEDAEPTVPSLPPAGTPRPPATPRPAPMEPIRPGGS